MVSIGELAIPTHENRSRAFIVFMVAIVLIVTVLFVMTWTEDQAFVDIFFEIVSAFGTVGLSRGITPDLTVTGKLLIALVMFAGRIGLFSFAVSMSEVRDETSYSYPEINLMVG